MTSSNGIGIDLGGSSIKAVRVNPEGKVLDQLNQPFDSELSGDWLRKIISVHEFLLNQEKSRECPVGISAPGLVSADGHCISFMPGRLQGLEGLKFRDALKSNSSVPVLNDAHSALLGENWIGAARGSRNVFMLTLGTGVGGAAIVDGLLLQGHIGRAGHLGHICLDVHGTPDVTGTPGSLENAIGNCTIEQRSNGHFSTTHELISRHQAGDANATRIWNESIHALACGICSLINVLDPELVIIGGGIARAGEALFGPLSVELAKIEWSPGGHRARIVPAQLGEYAGAIGAAWNGMKKNDRIQ
ncbi:MAG: ROK family protein [Verrucomicrobiota bacterium]|nr:ROK family protein [Verrucomicrobiota bacterium]